MDEYPDADEEFELMYADDLELLNELDAEENPTKTCRKSLDFTKSTTNNETETDINTLPLNNSFEGDFLPLTTQSTGTETQTSRKRTVEELFGDIDDLLNENDNQSKKYKSDKDDKKSSDYDLIEKLVELRKLSKQRHNPLNSIRNCTNNNTNRDKHNLSLTVPKYPFIGITRDDKTRIYIRFHSDAYEKDEMQQIVTENSFNGVMGEGFKEVWAQARDLINSNLDKSQQSQQSSGISILQQEISQSKQLWVDLYKPKKYLELLSDESTNRILLKWLKLWDKVVFHRKPKPKLKQQINDNKFRKKIELNTNLDESGRPIHKVALLCGPPGLGKTTLAHMIARHAGYNVVEINASDDRSSTSFKTILENATQMRSVVDSENRPNCIVFDEIDGAPAASIEFLVKFINSNPTNNRNTKGKSTKKNLLKRPIICICNDVYVPALRPLRQIAFVVNFPKTSTVRLAERLIEISRNEHVETDLGAMLALSEKSNNDIRTCLSFLHFFKLQNKTVKLSDIYKTNIGQKDLQKGLFAIWQEIFQIPQQTKQQTQPNEISSNNINNKRRMENILSIVNSFGDYERLIRGVYENFPQMKLRSDLNDISKALDWFCFTDLINTQIYTLQNYSLTNYLQYAFVVWHFIFASRMWQKLQYPSAEYEAYTKQIKRKAIVTELIRGVQPKTRTYIQTISLVLDILPLLSRIIVPVFRPISIHLYTKEEKEILERVVSIMIDYNLNYVQERTLEGSYVYNLDPDINEVITFSTRTNQSIPRRQLTYSNKQLISNEIETTKLRRFELERTKNCDNNTNKKNKTNLPNHLQTLQPNIIKENVHQNKVVSKDFFGRIITKSSSPSSSTSIGRAGLDLGNDIWYKFKEGYSNAVRKTIKVASLK